MVVKAASVPGVGSGLLQDCLVGGDPEQRQRERGIRRRALAISIGLQSAGVAAIVILPLFAKVQPIIWAPIPIPSYYHSAPHEAATSEPRTTENRPCHFCGPTPTHISPISVNHVPTQPGGNPPGFDPGPGGSDASNIIPLADPRTQPARPREAVRTPRIVKMTQLDPAKLIRRVEPRYPVLAQQTHRSGQVQLHAIIATDGTIQSLEVVSGDALFYQSALEAVRQWRYTPTELNHQPVEVDTFITVIYNFNR